MYKSDEINRNAIATNKAAGKLATFLVVLLFGFVIYIAIATNKSSYRMAKYKIEQRINTISN